VKKINAYKQQSSSEKLKGKLGSRSKWEIILYKEITTKTYRCKMASVFVQRLCDIYIEKKVWVSIWILTLSVWAV
jgi:hypothetical protein